MRAGLGAASLLWSGDPGALPTWGAALALSAGVAFVAIGDWERRRSADRTRPDATVTPAVAWHARTRTGSEQAPHAS
jgi:hypothetical protein